MSQATVPRSARQAARMSCGFCEGTRGQEPGRCYDASGRWKGTCYGAARLQR